MSLKLSQKDLQKAISQEIAWREQARKSLSEFIDYIEPTYQFTDFHKSFIEVISCFAEGGIKKLVVSLPPQHGKTTISSRFLPAYILGKNPDSKVAIGSYGQSKARGFSQEVRRIMHSDEYRNLFPDTKLPTRADFDYIDKKEEFQILDHIGSLKAVGRGSALTGDPVDYFIGDDLYKDAMEANSPTIRQNVVDWYLSVVIKRLHNMSQQLLVFTRWHEEDLIGFIEENEGVELIERFEQLDDPDPSQWYKINFPSLQEGKPTELDSRELGEALWEEKHSREKLEKERSLDPVVFACLNQGDPQPKEGILYSEFQTYRKLPEGATYKKMYCDVADTGDDYLCALFWVEDKEQNLYITDVIYTQESAEKTEYMVCKKIIEGEAKIGFFESNAGGRGYARAVDKLLKEMDYKSIAIETFHQSDNKEARVISNQSNVQRHVIMPHNWKNIWPDFYKAVTRFKKKFKSNEHDDGVDSITGAYLKSRSMDFTITII